MSEPTSGPLEPDRPEEEGSQPARQTPQWQPLAASLGTVSFLLLAGSPLVLASRAREMPVLPPNPLQPLVSVPVDQGPLFETPTTDLRPQRLPEAPLIASAPPVTEVAGVRQAQRSFRPGGIGAGPLPQGALSAQLSPDGVVRGPIWTRNALPNVGRMPGAPASGEPEPSPGPQVATAENSSELPNEQRVELSRLANPEGAVRTVTPRAPGQASADKPLRLFLSVNRPRHGYQAGETVTARVSANTDCYAALIRVDAAGRASTVFRSPGPSRGFACALKAGPGAGAEYLVAVGSVYPLDGTDAAAALRASGAGFPAAVPAVEGGAGPGAAWSQAVSHAAAIGGSARSWQRYEWAVDTASFGTRPSIRVAESRPAPAASPRKPAGNPESSTLPVDAPKPQEKPAAKLEPGESKPVRPEAEPAKEPSAMPTPAALPSMGSEKSALPPTTRQTK